VGTSEAWRDGGRGSRRRDRAAGPGAQVRRPSPGRPDVAGPSEPSRRGGRRDGGRRDAPRDAGAAPRSVARRRPGGAGRGDGGRGERRPRGSARGRHRARRHRPPSAFTGSRRSPPAAGRRSSLARTGSRAHRRRRRPGPGGRVARSRTGPSRPGRARPATRGVHPRAGHGRSTLRERAGAGGARSRRTRRRPRRRGEGSAARRRVQERRDGTVAQAGRLRGGRVAGAASRAEAPARPAVRSVRRRRAGGRGLLASSRSRCARADGGPAGGVRPRGERGAPGRAAVLDRGRGRAQRHVVDPGNAAGPRAQARRAGRIGTVGAARRVRRAPQCAGRRARAGRPVGDLDPAPRARGSARDIPSPRIRPRHPPGSEERACPRASWSSITDRSTRA